MIYRLEPLAAGLADPSWAISRSQRPCEIVADTPEAARCIACGLFTLAVLPQDLHAAGFRQPWLSPMLVAVHRVAQVRRRHPGAASLALQH
jgi:hypothetical protein